METKQQLTECLECGTKFDSSGEVYGICRGCDNPPVGIIYNEDRHIRPLPGSDKQANKHPRFVDKYSRGFWPNNDRETWS